MTMTLAVRTTTASFDNTRCCPRSFRKTTTKHVLLRVSVVLSLLFGFGAPLGAAQHFSMRRPWTNNSRYRTRRPRSSRSSSYDRYQQQRQYYYSAQQHDYSTHFLDEDWMNDRRCRLWRADLKSRRPGKLSWTSWLVRLNVAAYAAQVFFPSFTQWGLQIQSKIFAGGEYHRLLSPVFLHGGVAHLAMNMFSLQNAGPDVEKLFGPGRFLAMYLASGVAGNLLSSIRSPRPSLGASGAVFGVVGALYVFLSRHEWLLGNAGEQMTDSITQTVLGNLVIGALNPVVDNWGHLGGMIGGAAMAYWFGPRLYFAELPGTDNVRVTVDRPVVRLPRPIESLPSRIGDGVRKTAKRIKSTVLGRGIGGGMSSSSSSSDKPWRSSPPLGGGGGRPRRRRRRFDTPDRSIKPRKTAGPIVRTASMMGFLEHTQS